jgi:hypothetical protein
MIQTYVKALKNPSFILYCLAISFALVGYSSNFNILPAHIESQHFEKSDADCIDNIHNHTSEKCEYNRK